VAVAAAHRTARVSVAHRNQLASVSDLGIALPFRRAELRALAYLLVDNPDAATAELRSGEALRMAGDQFQRPLYDLFADPPVAGLEQLLAIWTEMDPLSLQY